MSATTISGSMLHGASSSSSLIIPALGLEQAPTRPFASAALHGKSTDFGLTLRPVRPVSGTFESSETVGLSMSPEGSPSLSPPSPRSHFRGAGVASSVATAAVPRPAAERPPVIYEDLPQRSTSIGRLQQLWSLLTVRGQHGGGGGRGGAARPDFDLSPESVSRLGGQPSAMSAGAGASSLGARSSTHAGARAASTTVAADAASGARLSGSGPASHPTVFQIFNMRPPPALGTGTASGGAAASQASTGSPPDLNTASS